MADIWNKLRRRAWSHTPTDEQLRDYLECFTAGYARGVEEAGNRDWAGDSEIAARQVAQRLGRYRSTTEAGCWLAGLYCGHTDHINGSEAGERLLPLRFGQCWDTGLIGDYAWQCASLPLRAGKILAATLRARPKSIRERVLVRQQLGVLYVTTPANPARKQTAIPLPE